MNLRLALVSIGWLCIATQGWPAENTAPIPINHIIYIIQENITFDHYFGTFPEADGIPKHVKLSYLPNGRKMYAPFHLRETSIRHDLNHSWQAAHVAYDGGKMDGFIRAEWPLALSYFWPGALPTVDPEDILPLDDNPELVKQDLDLANYAKVRPDRLLSADEEAAVEAES